MDTNEGNKLIAEFMGYKIGILSGWLSGTSKEESAYKKDENDSINDVLGKVSNLKYHSSWDWLMPVVHKAYEITTEDEQQFAGLTLFEIGLPTPINEIWQYVTEFIQWYNTHNKQLNLE